MIDISPTKVSFILGNHKLDEIEREIILATLDRFGGNQSKTAKNLGISHKTLYNKLKRYEKQAA